MALSVLAYNLTRVMNIVGIKPLIAAIEADALGIPFAANRRSLRNHPRNGH